MADVEEVEVVVAHQERATLRVGDVFLKIDADQTRTDVEVEAMALAPIPTPEVLWRKPPVLALAALPGAALGRLGQPSAASPAAWTAAGAAIRMLHDAPLPPWPGPGPGEFASHLDGECEWLIASGVLPADVVTRNRQVAEAALRSWTPAFIHGDLQVDHVFADGRVEQFMPRKCDRVAVVRMRDEHHALEVARRVVAQPGRVEQVFQPRAAIRRD